MAHRAQLCFGQLGQLIDYFRRTHCETVPRDAGFVRDNWRDSLGHGEIRPPVKLQAKNAGAAFFFSIAGLTRRCFSIICNFVKKLTYTISEAQSNLPRLCRSGRRFVISRRDKPVYVAMPLADYDALLETMEILSDPKAMTTLRAAKAGRLAYKELDLADEDFGL